jgi:hypothetical protein
MNVQKPKQTQKHTHTHTFRLDATKVGANIVTRNVLQLLDVIRFTIQSLYMHLPKNNFSLPLCRKAVAEAKAKG